MSEGTIGSVSVSVVPDARDFWRDFKAKTEGDKPDLDVRVKANTDEARAQMAEMSKSADNTTEHVGLLKKALIGIAPAAIPLGGVLVGAFAGLIPVAATAALGIEGISKAMQNGSLKGTQFGKDIDSLKKEFSGLEGIAGAGLLKGLTQALPSLKPLFAGLNQLVGTLATQLGRIIGTAGPALVKLFTALEPLFVTFGDLVQRGANDLENFASGSGVANFVKYIERELPVVERAFSGLFKLVGALGTTLAPIGDAVLRIFAQLGPVLAKVVTALAPVIKQIAGFVDRLIPTLAPLFAKLSALAKPLGVLFREVTAALLPVVSALAKALAPVIPILAHAFTRLFDALRPVIKSLSGALVQAIQSIAPDLPGMAKSLGDIAVSMVKVLKAVAPLIPPMIQLATKAIGPMISQLKLLARAVSDVAPLIAKSFKDIIDIVLQGAYVMILGVDKVVQHLPFVGGSLHRTLLGAETDIENFKNKYDATYNAMNHLPPITPRVNGGPALGILGAIERAVYNIVNAQPAAPPQGEAAADHRINPSRPTPTPVITIPPLNVGGGDGGGGSTGTPPPTHKDVLKDFNAFVKSLNGTASQALAAFRQLLSDERKRGLSSGVADTLKAENARLDADIKRRDDIAGRLTRANAKLLAAQKALATEARAIKSAITGSFDITTAGTGYNGSQNVSLGNIIAQQKQDLQKAKQFASGLRKLAAEGLNKPELRALAEAGPSALAQVLALEKATPKQILEINATEKATGDVGAGLGKDIGQDLYGSQIKTDRTLVKTLEKRGEVLEKRIDHLTHVIQQGFHDLGHDGFKIIWKQGTIGRIVEEDNARNARRGGKS